MPDVCAALRVPGDGGADRGPGLAGPEPEKGAPVRGGRDHRLLRGVFQYALLYGAAGAALRADGVYTEPDGGAQRPGLSDRFGGDQRGGGNAGGGPGDRSGGRGAEEGPADLTPPGT